MENNKMLGIMIDLETLGNKSLAAISHIGAVEFDTETGLLGKEFYSPINVETCVKAGLKIDGSTVLWWLQQSEEARSAFNDNNRADSLIYVLRRFSAWYPNELDSQGHLQGIPLWGNGASFDNTILADAYDVLQLKTPWPFWNDRCYRTLKNLYPDVKYKRYGTAHNALDDAKGQAIHLMRIFEEKGLK